MDHETPEIETDQNGEEILLIIADEFCELLME